MESNNKRIIKNTLYLYIRMAVIMALSFITTRIVLNKLGASDYGVYTLVGGFVSLFTVLNSILNSSTTRFLALYLGKGDVQSLKKVFSTAFILHLFIAIIVIICLETFGLWFLNSHLNIDPNRISAANWVFHFAVISTFLSITQTPYTATVTAHEHFNIYAIMSIFDVVAKILILYLLINIPGDKLIIYAALLLFVSICNITLYRIYCIKHFSETKISFLIDKKIFKEMLKFSGWGTFGHIITVINSQGTNILFNLFFNTIMNAARGLAQTVSYTIAQFVGGFLNAAQPQLVKYYGQGDIEHFNKLIFNVTQYTLFLLALIIVPVILEIDYVIYLWLGDNVPHYTTAFVKITVICSIIYRSNTMIDYGINAAGYVKLLNALSIPNYLLTIPLIWLTLHLNLGPITAYWISSIPPLLAFLTNLWIINHTIGFPSKKFFIHVFLKNISLIFISLIIPWIVQQVLPPCMIRFLTVCTISILSTSIILWLFALNKEVKNILKDKLKQSLSKLYIRKKDSTNSTK